MVGLPVIGYELQPLIRQIDPYGRHNFEQAELIRVCQALTEEKLPYWVAGGWGLDVLVGCQTRRHGDLDFVVDSFHDNLPSVTATLIRLGYHQKKPLGGTMWFPDAHVFEDLRGHHIEVLGINWKLLMTAAELLASTTSVAPAVAHRNQEVTSELLEGFTTTGVLEGMALPSLSVVAQELFHLGYKRREEDSHAEDVIKLLSTTELSQEPWTRETSTTTDSSPRQPSTLLLVPTFSFPSKLWRLCRLYRNDLDKMPPHVTTAIPFLPLRDVTADVIRRLQKLFDETPAFDFELNTIKWFGTNVVYLEPSERDLLRSMTERVQQEFPEFRPYDGEFDSVIPHVTLSEHGVRSERRALARRVPRFLPIRARASHVWLMSNERDENDWSIIKVFRLP